LELLGFLNFSYTYRSYPAFPILGKINQNGRKKRTIATKMRPMVAKKSKNQLVVFSLKDLFFQGLVFE